MPFEMIRLHIGWYCIKKKPLDVHLKAFNNLSHAIPMDGCKCGPDENRTHI
jgi:hypothetical protein